MENGGYKFRGFHEDERKKLPKELSMSNECSHGEVHKKAFRVGQVIRTKKDVKTYINLHAIQSKRSFYFTKKEKNIDMG